MSINRFKDKVAIITGSSRGIGKAIAIELAKKGALIVLNGRNQEQLHDVKTDIEKIQSRVISVCSDVSTIEGGELLITETINAFQRVDILVNNVGISMRGSTADLNPHVFKMVFESNVYGSVNATIPAIKYLRETKGSIVFISSLAGIRGLPYLSAYCSSKMAIRAIAESIRIEESKNNIHVGLILVGITDIEHNKETIAADGSKLILESRKNKKIQSMHSVAGAVLKNISKRKFITVLTAIGKLNAFMQPRFPLFVEKLLVRNLKKFEEYTK